MLFRKFSTLASQVGSALLDASSQKGKHSRYSLVGKNPFLVLEAKNNQITVTTAQGSVHFQGDPVQHLEQLLGQYRRYAPPGFWGPGAIGYISYELGYSFQNLLRLSVDDLNLPDLWFAFYDEIWVYDHRDEQGYSIVMKKHHAIPPELLQVKNGASHRYAPVSFTRKEYEKAFRKTMKHIEAGDIYQLNLCQRFSTRFQGNPWQIYQQLRGLHPTALSAFLNTGRNFILSASPELFLSRKKDEIVTCPIKGTRSVHSDSAWQDLQASEKDRAEHIMIVDLERNDLGRICQVGSITPDHMLHVENCGDVIHMVSSVKGKLQPRTGIAQILKSMFPGGSVTGAPKRSAMSLIGSIEPAVRGIYTGALGWIGFSGNFVFNLPIRTILLQGGFAHFHVGGGVVADSTAQGEYQEILDKGSAFFKVLGVRGSGLG